MPSSTAHLPFTQTFTQAEYERLSNGLVPVEMEDKWFIFLEGDWLYFHRSWTGVCIYQIRLRRNENEYIVAEALANREPDQYQEIDAKYDAALLNFLINNFLLGKRTPFPLPGNLPKDTIKGVYQRHISGSAYPELIFNKDEGSEARRRLTAIKPAQE